MMTLAVLDRIPVLFLPLIWSIGLWKWVWIRMRCHGRSLGMVQDFASFSRSRDDPRNGFLLGHLSRRPTNKDLCSRNIISGELRMAFSLPIDQMIRWWITARIIMPRKLEYLPKDQIETVLSGWWGNWLYAQGRSLPILESPATD